MILTRIHHNMDFSWKTLHVFKYVDYINRNIIKTNFNYFEILKK